MKRRDRAREFLDLIVRAPNLDDDVAAQLRRLSRRWKPVNRSFLTWSGLICRRARQENEALARWADDGGALP